MAPPYNPVQVDDDIDDLDVECDRCGCCCAPLAVAAVPVAPAVEHLLCAACAMRPDARDACAVLTSAALVDLERTARDILRSMPDRRAV